MGVEILRILPAALVAAVNVTALLVLIAVLSWSKRAGTALVAGFFIVFVVFGLLVLGVGLRIPDEGTSPVSGYIDFGLAALLYIVGILALLNRPRRAMDALTKQRTGISLRSSFALGLGLGITNPSSLIPYTSALKDLSVRDVGPLGVILGDAVFLVILMAPMLAPVVLAYSFPSTADKLLAPVSAGLVKHGHTIMGATSTGFAVYLTIKAAINVARFF